MAQLSDREIAGVAQRAGFTGNDVTIAVAVALAESGGRTDAKNTANSNGSVDYGLFQINSIHAALLRTGSWSNPYDNARFARRVWQDAGGRWTPWVTYNTGSYQQFMARAQAASGQPSSPAVPLGTNLTSDQPVLVPNISETLHTAALTRIPSGYGSYGGGLAILYRSGYTQSLELAINKPRSTTAAYTQGWESVKGTLRLGDWGVLAAQNGSLYGIIGGMYALRSNGPEHADVVSIPTITPSPNGTLLLEPQQWNGQVAWYLDGGTVRKYWINPDGAWYTYGTYAHAGNNLALVAPWGTEVPELWTLVKTRRGWVLQKKNAFGGGAFTTFGHAGPFLDLGGDFVWKVVRDSRRSNRLWMVVMSGARAWTSWSADNGRRWSKPTSSPVGAAAGPAARPRPSVTHANTGSVLYTMSSGMGSAPTMAPSPGVGASAGRYNLGAVQPHVAAAAAEIGPMFGITTIYGVGYRANLSDHPKGLALDFMVSDERGTQLANYVIANAGRLRGTYLIWRQMIHSFDSRGWRAMEDRGSPTANHMDHVHVSFY